MLSVSHGAIGALIASYIPNPYLAAPIIIASHFLGDYIPHWDVGQGLSKAKKSKLRAFVEELITDFPLSIALVYFWFQAGQPQINYQAWFGWFMGLLPDFIEFPHLFLNWNFTPIRQLAAIHKSFHRSIPNKVRGLLPQVAVLILVYLLKP